MFNTTKRNSNEYNRRTVQGSYTYDFNRYHRPNEMYKNNSKDSELDPGIACVIFGAVALKFAPGYGVFFLMIGIFVTVFFND
jgi:hypothetical protein